MVVHNSENLKEFTITAKSHRDWLRSKLVWKPFSNSGDNWFRLYLGEVDMHASVMLDRDGEPFGQIFIDATGRGRKRIFIGNFDTVRPKIEEFILDMIEGKADHEINTEYCFETALIPFWKNIDKPKTA